MKKRSILILFVTSALLMLSSCSKDEPVTPRNSVNDIAASANAPVSANAPASANGTVKDICGNTYNYVKIGSQYWMVENMRCNKYDTKSELAGYKLPTYETAEFTPYYADATNKKLWSTSSCIFNLPDDQVKKLGYLYSWGAAVGVGYANEIVNPYYEMGDRRQGICPNGWHLPSDDEWKALLTEIEKPQGKEAFSELPAGHAEGSRVCDVGHEAFFWTATNTSKSFFGISYIFLDQINEVEGCIYSKDYAASVRCVKN